VKCHGARFSNAMRREMMRSRASFLRSALGASLIASVRPSVAAAGGARPGPYCAPLVSGAADQRYDFALEILDGDGTLFRLADFVGSAVWLNFFASWCPSCNTEADRLVRLAEHYKPYGLVTVGIDYKETPEPVRAYRERHKVSFPIALDSTGSVFKDFGFDTLPTHLFFNRDGRITCVVPDDISFTAMDNEIAVALADISSATPSPSPEPTNSGPGL
jgi:peroxiredoxin